METLVIIGIERTGTNYLCSLLNQLPQVEARFEIFANVAAISLTPTEVQLISAFANQPFKDKTDPELIRYLKNNVDETLHLIQQKLPNRKQVFSFKIFREHLPQSTMAGLIQSHQTIFVTRTVIDTYISFMKALQAKVWINQNTTRLKPTLKIDHFIYWYRETLKYYRFCTEQYRHYKNENPVILKYDDFTAASNLENLHFVAEKVSQITHLPLVCPQSEFKTVF